MTIAFDGNGGAFTILGSIFCAAGSINGIRNDTAPSPSSAWGASGPPIRDVNTAIGNIIAAHTTAQQSYYDGIRDLQASFVSAQDGTLTALQDLAQSELIAIIHADNPQPDATLATAMAELIRQMKANSKTVLRCAVAATPTAGGSNVGNAVVLASVTGRFGAPLEYAVAETIVATCTGDADGNGTTATAGSEPITITCPAAEDNKLSNTWPDGSGGTASINVIDPNEDAGDNYLTNSNFEVFTVANLPDNWSVLVGTVGTDVKKDAVTTYGDGSTACVQFVGGATLTSIAQTFGAAAGSGTTVELKPATVYAVNLQTYLDIQPAAGVLKVELVDSTNTVINDDAGTANAITQTLSTQTAATWVAVNGFFRTPTNLPSQVKLRIRLSTAMSAGSKLNIDFGAFGLPTQVYDGGPYVIAFRASTDLTYGDRWTIAVTNDRAGVIQTYFERFFDMTQLGLILPSASAGNTIDDALVA